MNLTTVTHISVGGVMQGLGGPDEGRRGGFERGGWAPPLFADEAATLRDHWLLDNRLVDEITLLTYPLVVGQGTRLFRDTGPDTAVAPVDSRATATGATIQVYRPTGRPQYAAAAGD